MCFYGGNQNHFVIAIKSKIYHYSNCSIPIFIPSNIFTCFIVEIDYMPPLYFTIDIVLSI